MLCPHCGHQGKLDQLEFSSEYEIYYCEVCKKKYISYNLGSGELSELVPLPGDSHPPYPGHH